MAQERHPQDREGSPDKAGVIDEADVVLRNGLPPSVEGETPLEPLADQDSGMFKVPYQGRMKIEQ